MNVIRRRCGIAVIFATSDEYLLPLAVNCVRFCFWRHVCDFFVRVWNISGTAERICAKFTRKTCFVPRSDEFEGQGQRSRTPRTKTVFSAKCPLTMHCNALDANNVMQQQTGPFRHCRALTGVHSAGKVWSAIALFVYENLISPEPLNADLCQIHTEDVFDPSLGIIWSSRSKVKGQDHQRQKRHFSAFSAACVRFMFGKRSPASGLLTYLAY